MTKVIIILEVEVDEIEWTAANGVTRARVPQDVTRYVFNQVQQAPSITEVDGKVTLR